MKNKACNPAWDRPLWPLNVPLVAKSPLERIAKQSGIYALGNLALKLGGLLLIPLYVNTLSEASYGYFALLDATARVLVMMLGLGLGTGLLRFMTHPDHAEDHISLPFTAWATAMGVSAVGVVLVWALAPGIASALLDDAARSPLVQWMGLYAGLKVVEAIPIMLLRTRERAGWYVVATVLELAVLIVAAFLLLRQGRGVLGIMQAYAFSAGVGAVVLSGAMLKRERWVFRASLIQPLVRFGAPLVMAGLAALVLNIGDRYVLKGLLDSAAVGVYDWASRLGGVINMLFVQSFQLAFGVIGLKALALQEEGIALYRRTFRHFVIWTGWGVLGLSLFALDFTALIANKAAYLAADQLVLPIGLGFMAYGIYHIAVNVLYASGDTQHIARMVIIAALANVGLNIVLIPILGSVGAALTTGGAYALLAALAVRQARQHLKVNYAWRTLGIVLVLIGTLWGIGQVTQPWSPGARFATRVLIVFAYLPLLYLCRLYRRDELVSLWRLLQARRPQPR
ncbi:MAG: oligosaccharide flippase family protein [Rhodothermales bacterium]